jgi:predicted nucleotidyltransferase
MTDLAPILSERSGKPAQHGAIPNKGPFASEDDALRGVLQRLVDELDPNEVWLFGSRAQGVHQPDSDFDLLVVTAPGDGEAGFDYDRVYAPIRGLGVGCDVVPCRADEFAVERTDPTSLCWRVVQTGWRLYERGAPHSGILRSR